MEEDTADETVGKDHEKPVEGDEGQVHAVLPQVGHQLGQLLREEVLEHPLVYLEASEKAHWRPPQGRGACLLHSQPSPHAVLELLSTGPALPRGAEHGEEPGTSLARGRHSADTRLLGWSIGL